jgi:hypothetical protein
MRKIFLIIGVILTGNTMQLTAQEVSFIFEYDSTGNVKQRRTQVTMLERKRFVRDTIKEQQLKSLSVYPNPAVETVIIEGALPKEVTSAEVQIFTVTGQYLSSYKYDGNTKRIPVKHLSNGVYIVEISAEEYVNKYKIVVNHP